jgi:hypothetical protein
VEGKGILDRGMGVEGRDMVDEHLSKRSGGGGVGMRQMSSYQRRQSWRLGIQRIHIWRRMVQIHRRVCRG